jgi:hypothetical protein
MHGRRMQLRSVGAVSSLDYPCLVEKCTRLACYFAKDNRGKYDHVCYQHFRVMSNEEKEQYVDLS